MTIIMHQSEVPGPIGSRGGLWRAETTIEGVRYSAASRSGAPNELARVLAAAGIPDQPVQVTHEGLRGYMRWGSLVEMAKWTYRESATEPLRRVRWEPAPDRASFARGEPENRGEGTPPAGR